MFGEHMMKLNIKNILNFLNNDTHVDKRGYLLKKGEVNKGWQRRWFMLKGNMLFYYHNPHDTEPIGLIVLEGCSINSCSTDNKTFSITFQCEGSRTYNLCADDEESCTAWINSLQRSSYSYLRAQVDRMHEQVQALERKKDMYVDHIARRNEEDESSSLSPHQSRASSASGIETDSLKPQKIKTGLRAFSSPLGLRKKANTHTMEHKSKHRKHKETATHSATSAPCRTFEQMHADFAPGKPIISDPGEPIRYNTLHINNLTISQ
ncbi:sesquipedalian-2-like isoform X2 [Bolinopsis microptera]|uniref:sesquipedalian-2-like isoform X2 n=1 Tax=Bolinopsis microptera TaxID=2820187 RepID=UPI0030795E1A